MSNPYAPEAPRRVDIDPSQVATIERDYPDAPPNPPVVYVAEQWAKHRGDDFDRWKNPTKDRLDFKVFDRPGVFFRVVIEPDAEIRLPRVWRDAVHSTNDVGMIVGGLAPQLVRIGAEGARVHPTLTERAR